VKGEEMEVKMKVVEKGGQSKKGVCHIKFIKIKVMLPGERKGDVRRAMARSSFKRITKGVRRRRQR